MKRYSVKNLDMDKYDNTSNKIKKSKRCIMCGKLDEKGLRKSHLISVKHLNGIEDNLFSTNQYGNETLGNNYRRFGKVAGCGVKRIESAFWHIIFCGDCEERFNVIEKRGKSLLDIYYNQSGKDIVKGRLDVGKMMGDYMTTVGEDREISQAHFRVFTEMVYVIFIRSLFGVKKILNDAYEYGNEYNMTRVYEDKIDEMVIGMQGMNRIHHDLDFINNKIKGKLGVLVPY